VCDRFLHVPVDDRDTLIPLIAAENVVEALGNLLWLWPLSLGWTGIVVTGVLLVVMANHAQVCTTYRVPHSPCLH
jgi:uncharacterized integral membrane protein